MHGLIEMLKDEIPNFKHLDLKLADKITRLCLSEYAHVIGKMMGSVDAPKGKEATMKWVYEVMGLSTTKVCSGCGQTISKDTPECPFYSKEGTAAGFIGYHQRPSAESYSDPKDWKWVNKDLP